MMANAWNFMTNSSDKEQTPNDTFKGRVAVELTLSAILILIISSNIVIVIKLKVYKNFTSMSIMVCLTVVQVLRLLTYILRVTTDKYSHEQWLWYRITTDFANYLLGIVALVLLAQWHQTYDVLSNPRRAVQTMEKNWAKVAQIAMITTYTVLIIFDICVVIDDKSKYEA